MDNILIIIFIGLVILSVIQFIQIKIKSSKVNHQKELMKIDELSAYIHAGDIHVTDEKGCNILMLAAQSEFFPKKGERSYLDIIKQAVDSGIDINQQNIKTGKSALVYAIEANYNKEMVDYFLNHGAGVNLQDKEGKTALFPAVQASYEKYQVIVPKIGNVNKQAINGDTALMETIKYMKLDVINDLLDRGADVRVTNNNGDNAYNLAKQYAKNFYKQIRKSSTDEGTHHDTSNADEKRIRQYNHNINEMIRRLKCILENESYKYKKLKR